VASISLVPLNDIMTVLACEKHANLFFCYLDCHTMISRHWIGIVRSEKVAEYISHLDKSVFPKLNKIDGLNNSYYLKREVKEGTEFLIVTEWETVDAIITFAGKDYNKAVIDPYAESMMVTYDKVVRHYNI
jgi:heme-degrading monooxygenase HmoA